MLASLSGCAILRFALQAILPLRRVPYYVYCLRLVSEDNDSPSVAQKKKTARDRATLRPEQQKKRRNNGNTFLIENEHEFKFLAFVACILRTAACE